MGVSETTMESSVFYTFNKPIGRLLSVILVSDTFKKISLVLCKPFEEKKQQNKNLKCQWIKYNSVSKLYRFTCAVHWYGQFTLTESEHVHILYDIGDKALFTRTINVTVFRTI